MLSPYLPHYYHLQFTGTGTDVPLMDWLQKYTFPVESSYQDVEAAKFRYDLMVRSTSGANLVQVQTGPAGAHMFRCKLRDKF